MPAPEDAAEQELLRELSEPDQGVIDALSGLTGDIVLIGAGGKIGHGLALMASRALEEAGSPRRVIAVSRFRGSGARETLERDGIQAISCDVADPEALACLPEAAAVVYMVGQKFGTSAGLEADTWFANVFVPGLVLRRFPSARYAAYSSGNVYPFWPAESDGPSEKDPVGPVGEYAQSVVGRERIFQHFSRQYGAPVTVIRLNYANEPRYGVLVDLARRILAREPVDLAMGFVNVVWQGDANRVTLRSLEMAASPPSILNLAGPKVSVREAAEKLGRLLGVEPRFTGSEAPNALLNDGSACWRRFGPPRVDVDEMLRRIAQWLNAGRPVWDKPTHFEARDGKF